MPTNTRLLSNEDPNLVPLEIWRSQQAADNGTPEGSDEPELTPEERDAFEIVKRVNTFYSDAKKAREPYENFDVAWAMFTGDVWPVRWPTYRAKITINRIRAIVTFIAAVMTDNKPRFSVEPLIAGTENAADLLRRKMDAHWDTTDCQGKLSLFVLYGLIWGTGFVKPVYDPYANGGRGAHVDTIVAPYRVFTNRTATGIEDAEYIIHVDDVSMGWIRRNFPDKADVVYQVRGLYESDSRDRDRDYVREGAQGDQYRIVSAQNINGNITSPQVSRANPEWRAADDDSVEVIEAWIRDDTLEMAERQRIVDGVPQTEPQTDTDGLTVFETVGYQVVTSEIDGRPTVVPVERPKQKPVMETYWRPKFPNGRLVLTAAGRVLLRDQPVPFQTDGFPWAMWKDYDVGAFWGQGETIALRDPQIATNRILSNVYEILEKIGNPVYKVKKTAGVNLQTFKNKAGVFVPLDEMDALQPLEKPVIPREFLELHEIIRKAMGEVSGVNETVLGVTPAANTAFATIDQLQESGSATIRGKVRNLESGLTRWGKLRLQLMQQYDAIDRPGVLRERSADLPAASPESGEGDGEAFGPYSEALDVVQPASSVAVRFQEYTNADLQGQVEFSVVPVSSLSTSPSGLWNKWMTLYDKHIVDRRWFLSKFRIEGYRTELPRMEAQEARDAAQQAAAKDKSKPGPAPKSAASKAHRKKPPPPPVSQIPNPLQRAVVR